MPHPTKPIHFENTGAIKLPQFSRFYEFEVVAIIETPHKTTINFRIVEKKASHVPSTEN